MVRTIAVGVGGAGGLNAFAWAAEEAARDGARLLLLRVCSSCSPLARFTGGPLNELIERAAPVLNQAVALAGSLAVEQRVLRVVIGEPGPALADAAVEADLLVIGAGGQGNTVQMVVRHAHVPVVVVRGLPGGRGATFPDHVVVGVDGAPAARAALKFAFAYADLHNLPVAAAYISPHRRANFDPAAADRLRAEVELWARKYPRTRVRRTVSHGSIPDGLVQAAVGAHLLVVGDRHRGAISRARTGDVPSSVAHHADCPVAVIPLERALVTS